MTVWRFDGDGHLRGRQADDGFICASRGSEDGRRFYQEMAAVRERRRVSVELESSGAIVEIS